MRPGEKEVEERMEKREKEFNERMEKKERQLKKRKKRKKKSCRSKTEKGSTKTITIQKYFTSDRQTII